MLYKSFISLDPDTHGIYGARFIKGKFEDVISIKFEKTDLDNRIFTYCNTLADILKANQKIDCVYSEDQFFYNKATHKSIKKLTYITGAIKIACKSTNLPHKLITPQEWKGSLKDGIIKARIDSILKIQNNWNIHVYDSVGIGLYTLGKF